MRYRTTRAGSALLLAFLAAFASSAADRPSDDLCYRDALALLRAEMKMKVLERLFKAGFYVTPQRIAACNKERHDLAEALGQASNTDFASIEAWAVEDASVKKAEADEVLKLAETYGRKFLKAAAKHEGDPAKPEERGSIQEGRELELKLNEWRTQKARSALEMARYMERMAQTGKGRAEVANFNAAWEAGVRETYRHSLRDQRRLVESLEQLQKERMLLDGSLVALKNIQDGLQKIDLLRKEPLDHVKDLTEKKVLEYLKSRYPDMDEERVKWAYGKTTELLGAGWSTWNTLSELDKDEVLGRYPEALSSAKRAAVVGSVYNYTLGILGDLSLAQSCGPLFDVLKFYGEAIGIVPSVAQKASAIVSRMGQDYLSRPDRSVWAKLPDEVGELWNTSLYKKMKLRVASGGGLFEGALGVRYYMPVAPEVFPRGFASFDHTQYLRLCEALADERILFAASDAELNTVLGGEVPEADRKALKEKAEKTPFAEQDLVWLAQGRDATLSGKTWTGERLANEVDTRMNALADRMAVCTATGGFNYDHLALWRKFKELLAANPVALTPQQILNLFGTYSATGNQEVVQTFLIRKAKERAAARRGKARVGVPLVTNKGSFKITPGEPAEIWADVIVSDLGPGVEVEADVIWVMPGWAKGQDRIERVRLKNGLREFRAPLPVPKDAPTLSFDVKVAVEIVPQEGEAQPTRAVGLAHFEGVKSWKWTMGDRTGFASLRLGGPGEKSFGTLDDFWPEGELPDGFVIGKNGRFDMADGATSGTATITDDAITIVLDPRVKAAWQERGTGLAPGTIVLKPSAE